jgi:hypothetical protein
MFCARLDFAVDDPQGGKGLVVSEVRRAGRERLRRGAGTPAMWKGGENYYRVPL